MRSNKFPLFGIFDWMRDLLARYGRRRAKLKEQSFRERMRHPGMLSDLRWVLGFLFAGSFWRSFRYGVIAALGLGFIAFSTYSTLKYAPKYYSNSFFLILPGAGAGTSVNLDDVGSATSNSASPFSSPDVSPTQNYKRLLIGARVRKRAADYAKVPFAEFPKPDIRMIDQTPIMEVMLATKAAAKTLAYCKNLERAFLDELTVLREQEAQARAEGYKASFERFREEVDTKRKALTAFRSRTNLVSQGQFLGLATRKEELIDMLLTAEVEFDESSAHMHQLLHILRLTPETAASIIHLRSDGLLQRLLTKLNDVDAELVEKRRIMGPKHPELRGMLATRDELWEQTSTRAAQLTGLSPENAMARTDLSAEAEHMKLVEDLISELAKNKALSAKKEKIAQQIQQVENRIRRAALDASELEALERELQMAEAVYTSSVAMIDTSKTDIYASYPLVQLLEEADFERMVIIPDPKYVVGGGIGAALAFLFALAFLWLRLPILAVLMKSA